MSTPKKPGTDLAALKARLAKNKGGAAQAPAPQAPAPQGPAMPPAGGMATPPGQPSASHPMAGHAPPPAAAFPPPGQGAAAPPGTPMYSSGPSATAAPAAAPQPAAPPRSAPSDNPFGGGSTFDPSVGVIDEGDIRPTRSFGLPIFFAVAGLAAGFGFGWVSNSIQSKGNLIEQGQTRGKRVLKVVNDMKAARVAVAEALRGDLSTEKMVADPKKAAAAIETLLSEQFDQQQRIDQVFGRQMVTFPSQAIDASIQYFDGANRLKTDLGFLAGFLTSYTDALKAGGAGPTVFGIVVDNNGAGTLVGLHQALCGEPDGKPEDLKPCTNPSEAIALSVLPKIGGSLAIVPIGSGPGQVMPLTGDGVFNYAVGMEPQKNALVQLSARVRRIEDLLEQMAKTETIVIGALEQYVEAPNVDGAEDGE